MSIKILLADDQALMRDGMKLLLELEEDFSLAAEANNGLEALSLYKKHRPDVVLMDIEMPKMNGIEATQAIKSFDSNAKILILTTFGQEDYLRKALLAGAQGFLLKAISAEELSQSVRKIASGGKVLDSQATELLIDSYRLLAEGNNKKPSPLNVREEQIVQLLAKDLSNRDIAAKLDLAEGTVKNYISQIYEKLQVKDRSQIVTSAIALGLIEAARDH